MFMCEGGLESRNQIKNGYLLSIALTQGKRNRDRESEREAETERAREREIDREKHTDTYI